MRLALTASAVLLLMATVAEARPLRVLSLDQCADQYAMALAPDAELTLSPRSDDPDSYLRDQAHRYARARPGLEAALAARPDVVIRYWGGDGRLLRALGQQGVTVVTIEDATDFAGVRANVRKAALALGAVADGEALIVDMDARLEALEARASGQPALYMTAGGFTAGEGTLIDAIVKAAGFASLAAPGFAPVGLERLIVEPPARFILGFFDNRRGDRRGVGRHPVARRAAHGRSTRVDAALLGCPAWFAAQAAEQAAR